MPYNIAFNKEKRYLIYDLGTVTLHNFTVVKASLSLPWSEADLLYIILELAKIIKKLQGILILCMMNFLSGQTLCERFETVSDPCDLRYQEQILDQAEQLRNVSLQARIVPIHHRA
jgi:hypothetical protein